MKLRTSSQSASITSIAAYQSKFIEKLVSFSFLRTAIKYIRRTTERIEQRPPDSDEEPSILETMLQRGMSPQDAVPTVVDLLMAGIDTVKTALKSITRDFQHTMPWIQTANTIGFLLYYLARSADKQEILRREILSVVGPKGSPILPSSLNKLDYLKACVKEILRYYYVTLSQAN